MKPLSLTISPRACLLSVGLAAIAVATFVTGQGSLTPTGAPAPVMKTLDQIEPRTRIESLTGNANGHYAILAPGSYYLSSNISPGAAPASIVVAASDVTIDFNGFGITQATGATVAVMIDRSAVRSNICLRNGSVSGPAVAVVGETGGTSLVINLSLADLRVRSTDGTGNVCSLSNVTNPLARRVQFNNLSGGINFGGAGLISECEGTTLAPPSATTVLSAEVVEQSTVRGVTGSATVTGISASTVKGCNVASMNVNAGSTAIVTGITGDCVSACEVRFLSAGGSTGRITGILQAGTGSTVTGCTVRSIGSTAASSGGVVGIWADTVRDCGVTDLGAPASTGGVTGIVGVTVEGCSVKTAQGGGAFAALYGISASTVSNCSVATLTQAPANYPCAGIFGNAVTNSSATGISGSSSSPVSGIDGGTIRACRVSEVFNSGSGGGSGITTGSFSSVSGFVIESCGVDTVQNYGIDANSLGLIQNCALMNCGGATGVTDGAGVLVEGIAVRVEGCTIYNCDIGIHCALDSTTNLVIRNHTTSCTTNYNTGTNTRVGPILSGTGSITGNSPWANFTD